MFRTLYSKSTAILAVLGVLAYSTFLARSEPRGSEEALRATAMAFVQACQRGDERDAQRLLEVPDRLTVEGRILDLSSLMSWVEQYLERRTLVGSQASFRGGKGFLSMRFAEQSEELRIELVQLKGDRWYVSQLHLIGPMNFLVVVVTIAAMILLILISLHLLKVHGNDLVVSEKFANSSTLDGAAIVLMQFPPEVSARLFNELGPEVVQAITLSITRLPGITAKMRTQATTQFLEHSGWTGQEPLELAVGRPAEFAANLESWLSGGVVV